jgi:exodeoxyribonuclease VII small subunit
MSEEMNYEQAVKRLEEIVLLLEKNDVSLDEALKLFEEGTKLSTYCSKKLNEAKQKIIEIEKE